MNPGRWDEIIALFERALERPPAERDAWLGDVTTTDPELRAEVAAMLHADAHAHPLFDAAPADLAAAFADVPAAPPFETSQIGPYTLLHEIGRGGMGAVFLAERADVQKRVAVKVVAGGRSSAEHVERFLFERRVLAQLEHPGIARLLDAGIAADGTPWLAMEYVDGDPIDAWCDAHRATITERLQLFALVCDAVACAHRNLVVHRDLKPGNILVDATGQPRLVDFGIAKVLDDTAAASPLTRGTAHPLTPRYASPEQLAGRPLTTASDVYQLGLLLHELLSGRQPRTRAGRVHEAADSLQGEEPLPASQTSASDESAAAVVAAARATTSQRLIRALAGDLDAIVSMALRPEPERRYASALQMAEDIRRHVRGEPVAAGPDTTRYRLGKFARRNRFAVLAVAALIVALVGGTAGMAWQAGRATRAAATAALERDRAAVEAAKAQEVAAFLTELFRASEPQRALGREESARDLLDRGARRLSEDGELHDQPLVRAHLLHVLGGVYLRLGWTVEARALYEQAVALRRSHAATTPAELAESLHGLATVELNEARPDAARPLFEEILAIQQLAHGPEHPAVASALYSLAAVHTANSALDTAETMLRSALAIQRLLADSAWAALAATLNGLGTVLSRRGAFPAADSVQTEVLGLYRDRLDPRHPDLARAHNNAGATRLRSGDAAAAEQHFRAALDIWRVVLGRHPDVATALNNHGSSLEALGRLEEAEPAYRESLEMKRELIAGDHTTIASSLNNLGLLLVKRDELDAAQPLLAEALAMRLRIQDDRHPDVALAHHNLARLHERRGRLAEAARGFERALDIRRERLDPANRLTLESAVALARVSRALGDSLRAATILEWVLQLATPTLPPDDPLLADIRRIAAAR